MQTDYMSNLETANHLVDNIRKYWEARGMSPEVWVEQISSEQRYLGTIFVVRSDMFGGKPRG
jgi:hypothetical protein